MRALLLLALSRPATVAVEVDTLALPYAQTELLHGELMTRLVDEGHAVGTSGAVVIRLGGGGDVVHVEVAHGADVRARDVRGGGALLRLAVIHAVLELLAGLDVLADADAALTADPERAVVLEVQPDAADHASAVIAAALDAGLVVTPGASDATRRVCVGDREGTIAVSVVAIAEACPSTPAAIAEPGGLALALQHRPLATPSADAWKDAPVPETPREVEPPRSADRDPVSPPVARSRPPTWTGALGVAAGVQGRLRPAEAVITAHGDARHRRGLLLTARVSVAPSVAPSVAVADTYVTVGAGWAWQPTKRLQLDAAIAGGIAVHGFRVAGDRGVRLDGTVELPLGLAVALGDRVALRAAFAGGVDTRARSHERSERTLWSRDRWRVSGTLGVDVMLGRKLSRRSRSIGAQ